MLSDRKEVVQTDNESLHHDQDEIEKSSIGVGSPPEEEAREDDSALEELSFETEVEEQEFTYNLLQKMAQQCHDIASAGVLLTAVAPYLSLTPPYSYAASALGYKVACDGIEASRALTAKTYPLDGLRAQGNGSLKKGSIKTVTFKIVSSAMALTAGLLAVRLLEDDSAHPNESPSIHDEQAKVPLVGLGAVIVAKVTETGLKAAANCISESLQEEIERNPELSKWQVLGGYVVTGLKITAAGSTIFLYGMYAGDLRAAMNQDIQTMETLGAIIFFQTFEHLAFVPRPLSFLKVEKQEVLLSNEPRRVHVAMTNGQIARMVGLNTLKECLSFGSAYGAAQLCCSFVLPAMNEAEMFAPAKDEMAVYTEQLLLAGITTASYFGVKFITNILPSITSCTMRVTGLWGSMWSKPANNADAAVPLLNDVESNELSIPRNG